MQKRRTTKPGMKSNEPLILSIETSTRNCSVALSQGSELIRLKEESSDQYIHSEKLHSFIEEVVSQSGFGYKDLAAVAVSKGPGSYTGLRIGVSAAKGFCYSLDIPLLAVESLQVLAYGLSKEAQLADGDRIVPMIDARRMEVYTAIHDAGGSRIGEIEAKVIDKQAFAGENGLLHLLGDGADKCKSVLADASRFTFHDYQFPSASMLAQLAWLRYKSENFEDLAYFEPFYLKDFIAGKPKKLV